MQTPHITGECPQFMLIKLGCYKISDFFSAKYRNLQSEASAMAKVL
jgi:hypothetical protein